MSDLDLLPYEDPRDEADEIIKHSILTIWDKLHRPEFHMEGEFDAYIPRKADGNKFSLPGDERHRYILSVACRNNKLEVTLSENGEVADLIYLVCSLHDPKCFDKIQNMLKQVMELVDKGTKTKEPE